MRVVEEPLSKLQCHYGVSGARLWARRSLLACGLALLLTAVLAPPLHAQKTDVVTLQNGDAVTGDVKELHRGLLKYSTDDMGTIYVEWDRIARVTSRNYFEVELQSGLKYFGTLDPPAEDGRVVVSLVVPDTLELLEIVAITRIKATFWSRLSGFVDLGFSYAKANKNATFTSSGEVKYRGRKWAGSLKGESYFQSQETSELTSRNSLNFSVQRFLGNKWAAGLNTGAEQNQELQLDGRYSIGASVLRRAVQSNRLVLLFAGGVKASSEKFTGESPNFSLELTLGYVPQSQDGHYLLSQRLWQPDGPGPGPLRLRGTGQVRAVLGLLSGAAILRPVRQPARHRRGREHQRLRHYAVDRVVVLVESSHRALLIGLDP
jgi:hypothetical protein